MTEIEARALRTEIKAKGFKCVIRRSESTTVYVFVDYDWNPFHDRESWIRYDQKWNNSSRVFEY